MGFHLDIDTEGFGRASRFFDLAQASCKDVGKHFKEIGEFLDTEKDAVFASQGKTLQKNKNWASLSSATKKARKARSGYYKKPPSNPNTLRWTGKLQDDISKLYTSDSFVYKFTSKYAIYHHDGEGKKKRRLMELNERNTREMVKIIQRGINDAIGIYNLR